MSFFIYLTNYKTKTPIWYLFISWSGWPRRQNWRIYEQDIDFEVKLFWYFNSLKTEFIKNNRNRRTCNAEGLLLKPSRPVTAINQQIHAKVFGATRGPLGEAWSTYTTINETTFGIIFAADIKNAYNLLPNNVDFDVSVRKILNINKSSI